MSSVHWLLLWILAFLINCACTQSALLGIGGNVIRMRPKGSSGSSSSSSGNRRPTGSADDDDDWSSGDPDDDGSLEGSRRDLNYEEKLLRRLFRMYSPDARAGLNSSSTVQVDVQYMLLRIHRLDERTQVLTTTGLVITEWVDERLRWDPWDFGNLTEIVLPPSMIWLPELTIMNSAENMVHDFERMGVLVSYDGLVHWEPGGIFTTSCDIDITYFPFDFQNCSLVVGAWAYYSQRMNLTNTSDIMKLHDYTENGEWEILSTVVSWGETALPCCPGVSYSYVKNTLALKRRIHYYFVNIMLPCFMLSVLVLVAFCIPPEAGEKISCGISVLLAFTVFLLMVSETVPKTSLQMPVIAIYLMTTMVLGSCSLALSIFVLNVHHTKNDTYVPRWVQVIILTLLAGILCMRVDNVRHRMIGPPPPPKPVGKRYQERLSERSRTLRQRTGIRLSGRDPSPSYEHVSSENDLSPTRVRAIMSDVPYIYHVPDWRDVSRVLDRLFFFLVLLAMLLASFLTLASSYMDSHS